MNLLLGDVVSSFQIFFFFLVESIVEMGDYYSPRWTRLNHLRFKSGLPYFSFNFTFIFSLCVTEYWDRLSSDLQNSQSTFSHFYNKRVRRIKQNLFNFPSAPSRTKIKIIRHFGRWTKLPKRNTVLLRLQGSGIHWKDKKQLSAHRMKNISSNC